MAAGKSISARLNVKVTPNAGHSEVAGFRDGVLLVRVAAPPDKGKANRELVSVLAEALGIKKAAVSLLRGEAGRSKVVAIEGLGEAEIHRKLA